MARPISIVRDVQVGVDHLMLVNVIRACSPKKDSEAMDRYQKSVYDVGARAVTKDGLAEVDKHTAAFSSRPYHALARFTKFICSFNNLYYFK